MPFDIVDPEEGLSRCAAMVEDSQCSNKALPGKEFCAIHRTYGERQYNLVDARLRTRLGQAYESDQLKSLRDEVALTRILLEKRLNIIQDDASFALATPHLTSLLKTLNELVRSCHVLEQSTSSLISKSTLLAVAQGICQVIVDELQGIPNYEATVDRIGERISQTILQAQNNIPTQQKLTFSNPLV